MIHYALCDPRTGRVMQTCSADANGEADSAAKTSGLVAIPVPEGVHITQEAWFAAGELHLVPPAPDPSDEWNWDTKSWQANLSTAKANRRAEAGKTLRRRVSSAVIDYAGRRLNADAQAIESLMRKLGAIGAREALGQSAPVDQLVWRDADNQFVLFANQAEYKAWLCGLLVAIDARDAAARAWSWQKKALVDAASTIEDVKSIDLST